MDRAIRRMKKRLDREGVIRDVRAKRYFEKPSDKKRKARKVAAFTQMLRTCHEKCISSTSSLEDELNFLVMKQLMALSY